MNARCRHGFIVSARASSLSISSGRGAVDQPDPARASSDHRICACLLLHRMDSPSVDPNLTRRSQQLVGYARLSSFTHLFDVRLEALSAAECKKVFSETRSGTANGGRRLYLSSSAPSGRRPKLTLIDQAGAPQQLAVYEFGTSSQSACISGSASLGSADKVSRAFASVSTKPHPPCRTNRRGASTKRIKGFWGTQRQRPNG